jgi:hypothetical protein
VPIVLKSGSLNHLVPSEIVKACNEIALPLPLSLSLLTKCTVKYKKKGHNQHNSLSDTLSSISHEKK